jgi:hypothetical protein
VPRGAAPGPVSAEKPCDRPRRSPTIPAKCDVIDPFNSQGHHLAERIRHAEAELRALPLDNPRRASLCALIAATRADLQRLGRHTGH